MDDDARGSRDERESAPHQLDDELFLYEGGEIPRERRREITRVRIGPQVKDIPSETFNRCIDLAEVQFNGRLIGIGEYAFRDCTALRQVTIPASVIRLGTGVFRDCINLAKVHFDEGTNLLAVGDNAFRYCKALRQVTIPASVTRLGDGAFEGCSNLAEVQFDEGLEIIGEGALLYCDALQQVTIPSSVTKLGNMAFQGCSSLTKVEFNEGLQIIAVRYAFRFCSALRSVTIPSSVTNLGDQTFLNCTNLSEVILLGGGWLLNEKFLDRGLFSGQGVLNQKRLNAMVGFKNSNKAYHFAFLGCPLTAIKISIPRALFERMTRLPQDCRPSIEGRIRELSRLELAQDSFILACFPVVIRAPEDEFGQDTIHVQDTDNHTAESLHQVLRFISFHELNESSILIELAMWKSRLVEDRARADCRTSVPDPVKILIMEYCGFTDFLEPAIEGG